MTAPVLRRFGALAFEYAADLCIDFCRALRHERSRRPKYDGQPFRGRAKRRIEIDRFSQQLFSAQEVVASAGFEEAAGAKVSVVRLRIRCAYGDGLIGECP